MKALIIRVEDSEAALYKSKLALERRTMQQHLREYILAFNAGAVSATFFAPPEAQAAADHIRFLNDGTAPALEPDEPPAFAVFRELGINTEVARD